MLVQVTFAQRLAESDGPLIGLWGATGDPVCAEILAGSGTDLVMFDAEHGPITPENLIGHLQAVAGYPQVTALVRVPWNDSVQIKRFLDTGVQNIVVPMVSTVADAEAAVAAVHYPPLGVRGVGSAFGRASRWARVPEYVAEAASMVSCTVQIETAEGVDNAAAIAAVPGVDALFIGPTDLGASMGFPGPAVVADRVEALIRELRASDVQVGVNAFLPADADRYLAAGARFVLISADVTLLARGSEAAIARLRDH